VHNVKRTKEREIGERGHLTELCFELGVNLVESATEIRELPASLVGDEKLRHSIPINVPSHLERHIGNFLHRSAHFSPAMFSSPKNAIPIPLFAIVLCAPFHTLLLSFITWLPRMGRVLSGRPIMSSK